MLQCYNSLPIAIAGVYWTVWKSPTKFHIQTVMMQMNSHGQGIYMLLLKPFFHFALKCYVISKTIRCFWCTVYSSVMTVSFPTLIHDPEQNMFQHSS
jgi:hypothetical protein